MADGTFCLKLKDTTFSAPIAKCVRKYRNIA